jgi:hypothetical protein
MEREHDAVVRELHRIALDHRDVSDADPCACVVAVAAPMSMCRSSSLGALVRSSSLRRWIGLLADDPRHGPLAVSRTTRWPTRITGSHPPTPPNHRKPSSSM